LDHLTDRVIDHLVDLAQHLQHSVSGFQIVSSGRIWETSPWYFTRLASLGYVLIAVIIFAEISILLVALPLALDYARKWFPLFD
ncbi:hypothetical protein ACC687_40165, partial [Rhizobium ruizarguesonis]